MLVDDQKADYRFLFYSLLNQRDRILNLASGAAQQNINQDIIKNLLLPFPEKKEQSVIANVLASLDTKIDVNKRMNVTLESITKSIFKQWFIDFEFPNEAGKPYKSSGEAMVYSEALHKDVPEAWKLGSILDCTTILSGGTPKTEVVEYWNGNIPWVSARDVTASDGSYIVDTERKITQIGMNNSNAKLLLRNTTVVTARGVVGNYGILSKEMTINQTNYGLKAKTDHSDFFVFFSVASLVNLMKQHAYGTIFDTITTKTFADMKIGIPPEQLMQSFDSVVGRMMEKIRLGHLESRCLANTRDTLLPKLMSGKIRVPVEVRQTC